jgi:putative ABC transport system permease protein
MYAITLWDLRYRSRQFLIAVIGAGLVFALAVLLTGMVAGFHNEIRRTVAATGAETWVVPARTSGPFTSVAALPAATLGAVAKAQGVTKASPLVISIQTAQTSKHLVRSMMIGAPPKSLGQITPTKGAAIQRDGEAVVDGRLGTKVGQRFQINGREFTVVGVVHGHTMFGGAPDIWVTARDAQKVLFGGQDLITAVAVVGHPAKVPGTLRVMTPAEVRGDSLGPMRSAVESIDNTRRFMWIVAAVIVAALVYVSALQRLRDFAVMKAVGASSRTLFVGVALQSVIVTVLAAVFAASTAGLMKPMYNVPVEVPGSAYLSLPVVAVLVGIASSVVALRQAVNVDPALAFGA